VDIVIINGIVFDGFLVGYVLGLANHNTAFEEEVKVFLVKGDGEVEYFFGEVNTFLLEILGLLQLVILFNSPLVKEFDL
jgi:hypothetical protein